jgi:hypothetical protein
VAIKAFARRLREAGLAAKLTLGVSSTRTIIVPKTEKETNAIALG